MSTADSHSVPLIEMTNIREHCSWVHGDDPTAATEKAKDLVASSVARAAKLAGVSPTRGSIPAFLTNLRYRTAARSRGGGR